MRGLTRNFCFVVPPAGDGDFDRHVSLFQPGQMCVDSAAIIEIHLQDGLWLDAGDSQVWSVVTYL